MCCYDVFKSICGRHLRFSSRDVRFALGRRTQVGIRLVGGCRETVASTTKQTTFTTTNSMRFCKELYSAKKSNVNENGTAPLTGERVSSDFARAPSRSFR